jgi:predicted pyridoxine 5'-phosphate oxidase superfamily flavin-nucleotide-binding protein
MERLGDKFTRVENDRHLGESKWALANRCKSCLATIDRPVIIDVPFAEREMRSELENLCMEVVPVFIVEQPHIVRRRYEARGRMETPQNIITRCTTIADRAKEWGAYQGTSQEILKYLLDTAF